MNGAAPNLPPHRRPDGSLPSGAAGDGLPSPGYYVPGYAGWKFLMTLAGVALLLFGCAELWTPLRLLFFGARTGAEACRVVVTRKGTPDQVLTSDLQIKADSASLDRTYTFWNEFLFQTTDGQAVTVRASVGSQLKPLYPLLDEDGLPSRILVCYDPARPALAIFPGIFSTWFVPGALTALGLLCAVTGILLFYWADRPIELPHIPPQSENEPGQGGNPLAPEH